MCWTTNQKWRTKPRIAKKKIEVWKFYVKKYNENLLVSPWQREKIFQNMRHSVLVANGIHNEHLCIECFNQDYRCDWRIYCGFHSVQKGTVYRKRLPLTKELVIVGGYKYVFHPEEAGVAYNINPSTHDHNVIVQCFIPIGAEYYLNEDGEYVSNKIIIGDEIPLDKIPLSNSPLLQR